MPRLGHTPSPGRSRAAAAPPSSPTTIRVPSPLRAASPTARSGARARTDSFDAINPATSIDDIPHDLLAASLAAGVGPSGAEMFDDAASLDHRDEPIETRDPMQSIGVRERDGVLRIGDIVTLRMQDAESRPLAQSDAAFEGVLHGSIFRRQSVVVDMITEGQQDQTFAIAFRVVEKRRYSARKHFFARLEREEQAHVHAQVPLAMRKFTKFSSLRAEESSSMMNARRHSSAQLAGFIEPTLEELEAEHLLEQRANEEESLRAVGKPVAYGMPIQLIHEETQSFLAVVPGASAVEQPEFMLVSLDSLGSRNCLFSLQPASRVRSMGQSIQFGDSVNVVSVKWKQALHMAPRHGARASEINAAPRATPFCVLPFRSFSTPKLALMGGEVCRVYHSETDSFLTQDGSSTAYFRPRSAGELPFSFWRIELPVSVWGGRTMTWGKPFRLRNLITRDYLTFESGQGDAHVSPIRGHAPLLSFETVREHKVDSMPAREAFMRIRWAEGYLRSGGTMCLMRNDSAGMMRPIDVFHADTNVVRDDRDAVRIMPLHPSISHNSQLAAGLRMMTHVLLDLWRRNESVALVSFGERFANVAIEACCAMLAVRHHDTWILREMQSSFATVGVLDALVNLMRELFVDTARVMEICGSGAPESAHPMQRVIRASISLLTEAVSSNEANALQISPTMPTLLKLIGVNVGASRLVTAMLNSAPSLLLSLGIAHIDAVLDLIPKQGLNARCMEFLGSMCALGDRVFPDNQRLVAERLVGKLASDILPRVSMTYDRIFVTLLHESPEPQRISDFLNPVTTPFYAEFLRVLAATCKSRNADATNIVSAVFTFELLYAHLISLSIPAEVRAAAAELMLSAHVDTAEFFVYTTSHPSDFHEIPVFESFADVSWPGLSRLESPNDVVVLEERFGPLVHFVSTHLRNNCQLDPLRPDHTRLYGSLLRLYTQLIRMGLAPSRDVLLVSSSILEALSPSQSSRPQHLRYDDDPTTQDIQDVRVQICQTIQQWDEIYVFWRGKYVLGSFKQMMEDKGLLPPKDTNIPLPGTIDVDIERVQGAAANTKKDSLSTFIVDAARVRNVRVSTSALTFLFFLFGQYSVILSSLDRHIIVYESESFARLDRLKQLAVRLQHVPLMARNASSNSEQLCSDLREMASLLVIPATERRDEHFLFSLQSMASANGVHRLALSLMADARSPPGVIDCAARLLVNMCVRHPRNKELVYREEGQLRRLITSSSVVCELLTELFRDNVSLSLLVDEQFVDDVVRAIDAKGRYARFLTILLSVCASGSHTILRNQELVVRALLHRRDLLLLGETESEFQQLVDLASTAGAMAANSSLLFHAEQMQLFALCCEGKSPVNQARLRNTMSLARLQRGIMAQRLPWKLRANYCRFLASAYLHASVHVERDPDFWRFLEQLMSSVAETMDSVSALKGRSPDAELADRIFFCTHGVCALVEAFYTRCFTHFSSANDEFRVTVDGINTTVADALCGLLHSSEWDDMLEARGTQIRRAVAALLRRGIHSHFYSYFDLHTLERQVAASSTTKVSPEAYMDHCLHAFTSRVRDAPKFRDDLALLIDALSADSCAGFEALIRTLGLLGDDSEAVLVRTLGTRVLAAALKNAGLQSPQALKALQLRFVEFGAAELLIELVASPSRAVLVEALDFGVRLLQGGVPEAQDRMYTRFLDIRGEEFFATLHQLLEECRAMIVSRTRTVKSIVSQSTALLGLPDRDRLSSVSSEDIEHDFDRRVLTAADMFFGGHELSARELALNLMLFLQQMCEGHHEHLQNYVHLQLRNAKSFDLVGTTLALYVDVCTLAELCLRNRMIDVQVPEMFLHIVRTLTEFVQGCPSNQEMLAQPETFEACGKLLALQARFAPVRHDIELPAAVPPMLDNTIVFLISLLEGVSSPSTAQRLLTVINLADLVDLMDVAWIEAINRSPGKRTPSPMTDLHVSEEFSAIPLHFLQLLAMLYDYGLPESAQIELLLRDSPTYPILTQRLSSIEVLQGSTLQKVYFATPGHILALWDTPALRASRLSIVYNVERSNYSRKIQDFLQQGDVLLHEFDWQARLRRRNRCLNEFVRFEQVKLAVQYTFVVAIALCSIIFYEADPFTTTAGDFPTEPYLPLLVARLVLGMCLVNLLLSIERFIGVLTFRVPVFLYASRSALTAQSNKTHTVIAGIRPPLKPSSARLRKIRRFWSIATRGELLVAMFSLAVAFAMLFKPLVVVLMLFNALSYSRTTAYIMRSIRVSGKLLLASGAVLVLTIFMYAAVGFNFFRNKYFFENQLFCTDMLSCFMTHLNYGVRFDEGIGGLLVDARPVSLGDTYAVSRVIFESSYFVVIVIVLFGIFAAVIVDSFSQLRASQDEIEHDIDAHCFVCVIERPVIDRYGSGFAFHCTNEHNMWSYLAFIDYLRRKQQSEYTAIESYLWDKISAGDISFFPLRRALNLSFPSLAHAAADHSAHMSDDNRSGFDPRGAGASNAPGDSSGPDGSNGSGRPGSAGAAADAGSGQSGAWLPSVMAKLDALQADMRRLSATRSPSLPLRAGSTSQGDALWTQLARLLRPRDGSRPSLASASSVARQAAASPEPTMRARSASAHAMGSLEAASTPGVAAALHAWRERARSPDSTASGPRLGPRFPAVASASVLASLAAPMSPSSVFAAAHDAGRRHSSVASAASAAAKRRSASDMSSRSPSDLSARRSSESLARAGAGLKSHASHESVTRVGSLSAISLMSPGSSGALVDDVDRAPRRNSDHHFQEPREPRRVDSRHALTASTQRTKSPSPQPSPSPSPSTSLPPMALPSPLPPPPPAAGQASPPLPSTAVFARRVSSVLPAQSPPLVPSTPTPASAGVNRVAMWMPTDLASSSLDSPTLRAVGRSMQHSAGSSTDPTPPSSDPLPPAAADRCDEGALDDAELVVSIVFESAPTSANASAAPSPR